MNVRLANLPDGWLITLAWNKLVTDPARPTNSRIPPCSEVRGD